MTRLPLDLILYALQQEATRTGNPHYSNITPATLRKWKQRGHLTPGPGYDIHELTTYLDQRHTPQPTS